MSEDLVTRVQTEADQCRNDGADDIARLLDEVAQALATTQAPAPAHADALSQLGAALDWITDGVKLNANTSHLVLRFARALAEKLSRAEVKYGYSDGWMQHDWMDECRAQLVEHVAKGDPRDVAAYCAFLWHHGQSTAAPATQAPAVAHPAWQPIKTAPKDGTHILVWTEASDTAYVVCWADAAKGIRKYLTAESGAERGWHLAWDGELFDREHEPTHWMPLPDAPASYVPVQDA